MRCALVRDMGLGVVDRLPNLKSFFIREAAGITGDVPKGRDAGFKRSRRSGPPGQWLACKRARPLSASASSRNRKMFRLGPRARTRQRGMTSGSSGASRF